MARLILLLVIGLLAASCAQSADPPQLNSATAQSDVFPSPQPATATDTSANVDSSDNERTETAEPKQSDGSAGEAVEPATSAASSEQLRIRLDGPTQTFSLDNAERTVPRGILREVGFFGGGGGDGPVCDPYLKPTVVDFWGNKFVTEWMVDAVIASCGWDPNENVLVQVISQDGKVMKENTMTLGGMEGALYFQYTPDLNSALGVYTVRLSGISGSVEQTIEVQPPNGPRVYMDGGRIVLFQFQPNETIRLYSYEPISIQDAFVASQLSPSVVYTLTVWNEFVTDAEGQLIIEGYPGSIFRIVGEQSGEVKVTPLDTFHSILTEFKDVSVLRPTDEEISQAPDIWSLVEFIDHVEPGERTYELTTGASEPLYWRMRWCAVDTDILKANLTNISMDFKIDGLSVGNPQLRMSEETHENTGWACFRWATIVTNWPIDRATTLEIEYELRADVDDGRQIYPAGAYRQVVIVRSTPDAGNSSAITPPADTLGKPYEPPPAEYVMYEPLDSLPTVDSVKPVSYTHLAIDRAELIAAGLLALGQGHGLHRLAELAGLVGGHVAASVA